LSLFRFRIRFFVHNSSRLSLSLKKEAQMKLSKLLIPLFLTTNSSLLLASESFKQEPIEPIMVTVPAGSFQMGSDTDEKAQPVHKVTLPEFSLGKYEVTVKEFRRFIEATGYEMPKRCYHEQNGWFAYGETDGTWQNNALNTSELQPVNCAGWKAADAYTQWLAKETGKPYRLPSESEWEYAARAGTETKFYFGDDPEQTLVCEYENTADLTGENILQRNSNTSYVNFANGKSNCVDHSAYASIVGMYKANPFGLHDMLSNVSEYTADCYHADYKNAPSNGLPRVKEVCEQGVIRGGSWHWNTFAVSRRGYYGENFVGGVEGFRVALDGATPSIAKRTKQFAWELKTAQHTEQLRRDSMLPYPDPVTNLTLTQKNGLVRLSWDKSQQSDVESYRVYRNGAAGSTFKLLAANLYETNFKDANFDFHQYEYTVVAVRRNQQSDYSNMVKTQVHPAHVPGRIEAEATIKIKGASAGRTSDDNGKFNLSGPGGIADEATMEYQLEVAQSGNYTLSFRVAAPKDTKGFAVLVNEKEVSVAKIAKTGGYHDWQTQTGGKIYLKKGNHKLLIKSLASNWKLNWLELNQG